MYVVFHIFIAKIFRFHCKQIRVEDALKYYCGIILLKIVRKQLQYIDALVILQINLLWN